MPTYISLMTLTEQGIKEINKAPQRIADAAKGLEALGGKLVSIYAVMGEYDYVAIAEAPSDEVAMTFLLVLGGMGNTRTTTLRAFSKEEFAALIEKLR